MSYTFSSTLSIFYMRTQKTFVDKLELVVQAINKSIKQQSEADKRMIASITKLTAIDDATALTADTTMSLFQRESAFEDPRHQAR